MTLTWWAATDVHCVPSVGEGGEDLEFCDAEVVAFRSMEKKIAPGANTLKRYSIWVI